ncbi:MAG: YlbF family regulator [Bacteroidota bacterium]
MVDIRLKLGADEFVRYLSSSNAVKEFQTAKGQFDNNPAIVNMRGEYTTLAKAYQEKERSGTVTQDDISGLRTVQKNFNAHPATERYGRAQQALIMLLQECNGTISEGLGFDFAATAAPAASC